MPLVILIDKLFTAPLGFVFSQIADAVNAELDDEGRLKEELLSAQMKLELGEISDEEFAEVEAEVLARLRDIREARGEGAGVSMGAKVVGAEVTFGGDADER